MKRPSAFLLISLLLTACASHPQDGIEARTELQPSGGNVVVNQREASGHLDFNPTFPHISGATLLGALIPDPARSESWNRGITYVYETTSGRLKLQEYRAPGMTQRMLENVECAPTETGCVDDVWSVVELENRHRAVLIDEEEFTHLTWLGQYPIRYELSGPKNVLTVEWAVEIASALATKY